MARDGNETLFRVLVDDIYETAESYDRDKSEMTPEVIEKVCLKLEAMDFTDMSQTIDQFIGEAIDEVKAGKPNAPEFMKANRREGGDEE